MFTIWHTNGIALPAYPFVFAFWAVRSGADLGEQAQVFYSSREQGLKEVDSIATVYSQKLGVEAAEIRTYILENLNYSLDQSNLRGLQTFFDSAAELGLTSSSRPLEFYPTDGQEKLLSDGS